MAYAYSMERIPIPTIILIVIVSGLWLFFQPTKQEEIKPIYVLIQSGKYIPDVITAPAGKPIVVQFLREDASLCAASLIFPALNAAYDLPYHQPVNIVIPAQNPGIYEFTCRGGKFKGALRVQ